MRDKLFELSADMLGIANSDGYFTDLNPAWERTLGWSREELMAKPLIEFVHPDDRPKTIEAAASKVDLLSFDNRYRHADGSYRAVRWDANHDGDSWYFVVRDETERVAGEKERAELLEELGTAEERFRRAFDDAPIGMGLAGLDEHWLRVNEALCDLTGYTAGDLLEKTFTEITHPDDATTDAEQAAALLRGDVSSYQLEKRYLHADGNVVWGALSVSLVRSSDGAPRYFIRQIKDVSQHKSDQAALEIARDGALEASRLKSEFLANMSHEIRTPMNGVIGMTELLMDTPLSDEQRAFAETMRLSGDTLLALIDDILDFSKIEAGHLELAAADFDPAEVIRDVGELLAPRAHAKGLELVMSVGDEMPAAVLGDRGRLQQILTNLVANAVKFTESGYVRLNVDASAADDARLRFEVTDSGVGIDVEHAERLFGAFVQADTSTRRAYGGTGLGLAISRQLVHLMDGEMGVRAVPAGGSTFWFEIPLPERPATVQRGTFDLLADKTVLLVDDHPVNRSVLEHQVGRWARRVQSASGAESAVRALQDAQAADEAFDIALLDLKMPGIDGLELARWIKSQPQLAGTVLLLLTSSGYERTAACEAGIAGYLTKPVRESRLMETLASALDSSSSEPSDVRLPTHATTDTTNPLDAPIVLIAEDNAVNQLVAAEMVRKRGFRTVLASDGEAAVRILSHTRCAAVFMDCQMPLLDGYEATARIRAREGRARHTPIIALTAHALNGDRERCLGAGMDDYLAKPLRPDELGRVLARWLPAVAA